MSEFGIKLKELRRKKYLTQDELAYELKKLGCNATSKCAISQYENGKRLPDVKALAIIAKFFSVSLDYLLGDDYDKERQQEFLTLFSSLDKNEKMMVEAYMTALIERKNAQ